MPGTGMFRRTYAHKEDLECDKAHHSICLETGEVLLSEIQDLLQVDPVPNHSTSADTWALTGRLLPPVRSKYQLLIGSTGFPFRTSRVMLV